MSEKVVQLNEEIIKDQSKELARGSVEETLLEKGGRVLDAGGVLRAQQSLSGLPQRTP